MGVPGVLFMAKNTETVGNAAGEAGFTLSADATALAAYYLFLVGMVLFAISMLTLNLTIGVSPPLAVTAALSGPISVLLFMAIMKTSITGIPGIMGPPLPARVVLIVIGAILNINVIMHIFDGDVDALEWEKFAGLYILAVGVPHLVGAKHRAAVPMV